MTVIVVILVLFSAALVAALVLVARRPASDPALRELLEGEQRRRAEERHQEQVGIAERFAVMSTKLDRVTEAVHQYDSDAHRTFGALSKQLSQTHDGLAAVLQTNQKIHEVLANPKARGRLGERIADDILQLCEFRENVNYRKQRSVEAGSGIPDFTFLLPNDLLLHMDVKFPLDNYWRFVEADSDLDRKRHRDAFLRDVRARIKDLSGRQYIDPAGGTVDFVLLFMPAEELYGFIHENDESLLADAIRQRVVLCSPFTLFTVVALIRQTVESFQLARRSDEILELLGEFSGQWTRFVDQMEKMGQRIDSASKEYETLVGTRKRMLERPLTKIAAMTQEPGLVPVDDTDDDNTNPLALEA